MYIAVCDDRAEDLNVIMDILARWQSERRVILRVEAFRSTSELLNSARKEPFTLYFLDVIMPGISGMEAARQIREFDAVADIVFLTVSPSFAYESYGVGALDYLLKPIGTEQVFSILDKLFTKEQRPENGLTLKSNGSLIRIPFSQLAFVEVLNKHLYFNLVDGSVREVFGSLSDYEALLLSQPEFRRVHRSYIVNLLQVMELSSGSIRTFSGKNLPVSRQLYPQLQKDYLKLLFTQREE